MELNRFINSLKKNQKRSDLFGLDESTINIIKDYFKKNTEIKKVLIYGSRAKGTEQKGSDIDFAIITYSKEDICSKVAYELDQLPTPYMFDVVDYNKIDNPNLKSHIDRIGKMFYSSNDL